MSQVTFTVYAKAEPQGSKKAFVVPGKNGGPPRAVVVDDNKATMRSYRQEVTREAMRAMSDLAGVSKIADAPMMAGHHIPVELYITFTFVAPPSASKRQYPVVKPDLDKLVRSTLDALTGVLFVDDSQVVRLTTEKVYGTQEQVHINARVIEQGKLF